MHNPLGSLSSREPRVAQNVIFKNSIVSLRRPPPPSDDLIYLRPITKEGKIKKN